MTHSLHLVHSYPWKQTTPRCIISFTSDTNSDRGDILMLFLVRWGFAVCSKCHAERKGYNKKCASKTDEVVNNFSMNKGIGLCGSSVHRTFWCRRVSSHLFDQDKLNEDAPLGVSACWGGLKEDAFAQTDPPSHAHTHKHTHIQTVICPVQWQPHIPHDILYICCLICYSPVISISQLQASFMSRHDRNWHAAQTVHEKPSLRIQEGKYHLVSHWSAYTGWVCTFFFSC